MTICDTHVFLGPTLDLNKAKHCLPSAHFHPPIQCGDIIRLLRLSPKCIVIIDGLFEQVPAVWHKEIMLALDQGIEVYGAASMGALRAAELHHYGMVGVGKVFQAFATQELHDDDEVAVLHQGEETGYLSCNDAMVNIRETLNVAYQQNIISLATKNVLIKYCKSQFYPHRSLLKGLNAISSESTKLDCDALQRWLQEYGLVDIKRQDAIAVLEEVQKQTLVYKKKLIKTEFPYTKFLASLIDEEVLTPFKQALSWLPEKEKVLHRFSVEQPARYKMVEKLASLMNSAYAAIHIDELLDSHASYLSYIKTHNLYFSSELYQFFHSHPRLSVLSSWLLHYICLSNMTKQKINHYASAAAFYFNDETTHASQEHILYWIVLFVLLLQAQINDKRLLIKYSVFEQHLDEIHFWENWKQYKSTSPNVSVNIKTALEFIRIYMGIVYVFHGVKDFKLGLAEELDYFHWIHDAMALYEITHEFSSI